MNFIKKYRYTLIMLLIFLLLVLLGVKVKSILVPDEGKATYGKRLEGIENYPIESEIYSKIDEEYGKNDKVKTITHRLQGKVLNYVITVDDKVSIKDAKSLGDKLITYFNEDQLGYYSIHIYLAKEDETLNNFPIIGMKDPLSKVIEWTKDRDIVKSDSDED